MKIKITNKFTTPVFAILTLIIFGATIGTAAPGDLDPTFGVGGKLIDGAGYELYDIAIQPDGKIVVAGSALGGSEGVSIAVARYNINGSPDTTFGSLGRVLIDRYQIGVDVAIQPDAKIVIAGRNPDGEAFGIFVRLTSNGSLDTSFGTNGILEGLFLPSVAAALPDGKLLIAQAASLFRLDANGSFDSTFSQCQPGVTTVHYLYNRSESVIQSDGKILTAFTGDAPNNEQRFGVFRCNADGTLDTGFGSGGVVITPMSSGIHVAQSITIQMNGKIVVAGQSRNDSRLTVVRYNPNGSLDTGFGSGGIVTTPIGITHWVAVSIQTDGKIVASTTSVNGSNSDFALVRYNTNGSLDTTFGGGDGITTLDFNQSNDDAHGMTLDSRGRAVVVGGSNGMFAIARFLLAPPSTPFDFDGDGKADTSVFRPSDHVWYLNQSTNGFSATQFGLSSDKITPADFDGDGKTDISVYRDGTWYWLASSNNYSFNARQFGIASDIPVPADFTGDGRADLAIYRNGTWWIQDLTNNQTQIVNFGLSTDKPVVADYDGDGRADQAIYRDGVWHLNRSTQGYAVVNFGLATDKPVIGDYDGDGRTDQAVYRDGVWYLLQSSQGYAEFRWGIASDIPAPADYDGDGRTDAAVYRGGVWYLRQTTSGVSVQNFGLPNDKPVPAAYLP